MCGESSVPPKAAPATFCILFEALILPDTPHRLLEIFFIKDDAHPQDMSGGLLIVSFYENSMTRSQSHTSNLLSIRSIQKQSLRMQGLKNQRTSSTKLSA